MELRRPTLEDKEAILEMIAEFDAAKSYMHGGMGSAWKRAKDKKFDCRNPAYWQVGSILLLLYNL